MSADRQHRLALILLIVGAVLISASGIYVKLSETGPTSTGFYRMFLSMPVYWIVLLIEARQRRSSSKLAPARPISRRGWGALWISGFFLATDLIAWHWAMKYISVAAATLLACTAPIWVALLGFLFLGERFSAKFLAGLAVSIAGVSLLILGGSRGLTVHDGLGVVLGILAAVSYAFYLRGVKAARDTLRVSQVMFWNAVIASAILAPIALATEAALVPQTIAGWGAVLGLAMTSQVIGQGLIGWSMAHLSAAFSSVTLLLTPVASAILAWITLGETLTALQIGGGVAVLVGIILAKPAARQAVVGPEGAEDAATPSKGVAA
ncbi:DMT family transporter [Dongia soli]|uniref:DMT family transporter n=1 Tax=Dongia soli TaxID=600628 RepID=A0ABU5EDM2_9PROT|nr:DMT family transporter [Dongia soli]MDY0884164.1 DMT family transporter [Dongia soli]